MGGLGSLLNIARDSLLAQSFALDVTGQNITNVNTPGYVRRSPLLVTRNSGDATFGSVDIGGIQRAFDVFSQARFLDATGTAAAADQHDATLSNVEALFNDAQGAGLSTPISQLFSSFSALSAHPNDTTTRQQVLARASDFAQALNSSASQLAAQRDQLLTQARGVTQEINSDTSQIARLNLEIAHAKGVGNDASDLLDKRDNLVGDLAQLVNVQTFTEPNGTFVVRGAGTTLLEGEQAATVAVTTSGSGNLILQSSFNGGPRTDITSGLASGKLAGLRETRDVDSPAMSARIDQLANDVAKAINTQHQAGVDLNGTAGLAMFTFSGPPGAATITLNSSLVGRPDLVAAASAANPPPGGSDNAVALAKLGQANIVNGNTRTPAEAYGDLIGDIGQRKSDSASDSQTRGALLAQTKAMRDSANGVSLDEELVSLQRYQRAYQAATKLISIADEAMNSLLQVAVR